MEHINLEKYIKADGKTIDFDTLYTEGMSDKTLQAIKKIEQQKKKPTGILSIENMLKMDKNIAERKMPFVVFNSEQKKRQKRAKKEQEQFDIAIQEMLNDRTTLDEAVKEDVLMENEIINRKNKPLEHYNQSETLNVFKPQNRWGKLRDIVIANTRLGRHITENYIWNFGSIGDYNVDGVPRSKVTCKGTEITTINIYDKQNRENKQLISRRFCSDVLYCWKRMTDIPYTSKDKDKITAISLWGVPMEYQGIDSTCVQRFIKGEDVIKMLKDIIFVLRNKKYDVNKISNQLEFVITRRVNLRKQKRTPDTIINDMKNRLYYTYQCNNLVWGYPKVSPEYIIGLLNQLNSGEFDIEIMLPIISNLWKYPIVCTEYHKPKDNKDHKKQADDYAIDSYIFERD